MTWTDLGPQRDKRAASVRQCAGREVRLKVDLCNDRSVIRGRFSGLGDFGKMWEQRAVLASPYAHSEYCAARRLPEQSRRQQDVVDLIGCGAVAKRAGPTSIIEILMRRDVLEIGALNQGREGVAVRRVVEVANDNHVVGSGLTQVLVDRLHSLRLRLAFAIGRGL